MKNKTYTGIATMVLGIAGILLGDKVELPGVETVALIISGLGGLLATYGRRDVGDRLVETEDKVASLSAKVLSASAKSKKTK